MRVTDVNEAPHIKRGQTFRVNESAAAGAERFGRLARQWAADGAVLIGGCCRTRPDHIAAVARELRAAEEEHPS